MPISSVPKTLSQFVQGMRYDSSSIDVDSFANGEASAEIPFGVFVKRGTAIDEFIKLTATTDKLIGVTLLTYNYVPGGGLGTTGIVPNRTADICRRGRVVMPVEEAVTPASAVLVRCVAAGAEVAGALRDTADGSDCVDISKWARFITSTTGAGLVVLEFDVTAQHA